MKKQNRVDFALRTPEIFETEKLLIRKTGDRFIAAKDISNYYFDTLVHGIYLKDNEYDLDFLLAILNSYPATAFYRLLHDIKGKVFAKISLDKLGAFPIPNVTLQKRKLLGELAKKLTISSGLFNEIILKFSKYFSSSFTLEKLAKKLQNWHNLEFGEFIKELNKAIKGNNKVRTKEGHSPIPELTKKDEFEWMDLFEENRKKAVELQWEIEKTDEEIDLMVYKLYDLTYKEVLIVDEGFGMSKEEYEK